MNRKNPVLKTHSAFFEQFDFLKKILFTFIIVFLLGVLNSCASSIDDVVDNYNTNFTSMDSTSEKKSGIAPGEPGFDEKNMLSPKYFLRCDGTLSLYAPPGCASYQWKITKVEEVTTTGQMGTVVKTTIEKNIICNLANGSSMATRAFSLYVPSSGLKTGTYKLALTVTGKEGNSYTDDCIVIIYFMN